MVGGFDGAGQLTSVERYDTERQEWEFVAPIQTGRSAFSLTALDGKLYAMGGYDGTECSKVVEIYDPVTNEWTYGTELTSGRSGHAAAVIYQPCSVTSLGDCHEAQMAIDDSNSSGSGGGSGGCLQRMQI